MPTDTSKVIETTVHIKELPVLETLSNSARIIIEDDQDTKQMTVERFLKIIESVVDSKINTMLIESKIKKMDEAISKIENTMNKFDSNEADRETSFATMQKQFNEFLAYYQQIKNTWDNQMVPFYNNAVVNESERKSNEQHRTEVFQQWTQSQNTMEDQEAARQAAEAARVKAENSRVSAENDRVKKETKRQQNETERIAAETERKEYYEKLHNIVTVTD